MSRDTAPVNTEESRPAPEQQGWTAASTGGRQRAGKAVTDIPKVDNASWFFLALIGGGAIIWWTKSAFSNAWFAAVVAAGVVLALMAYYMLNDEDAPEEEGDNVYYLGLLFTLISLMFTLWELFGANTGVVHSTEKIHILLENFGIALTSTVVGIAGRVAVQNWQNGAERKSEPDGTVIASPRDLEMFNRHTLGRIARDLTQGANALARFHRIVRSHASDSEDYLRNHSETLKLESAAFKDMLQRNTDTFVQELKSHAEGTLDTVGSSIGATAKQAEALLEQVRSTHDSYLTEVRETTRSFHDEIRSTSGQSLETLRQNFEATAQQALSLAQELKSRAESTLGTVGGSLSAAAKQAEALLEQLRSTHDSYLTEVRETTKSFHDEIRSTSGQSLETLRQNFEATAQQALSLAKDLSTVHERTGEAFERLESDLGHAGDAGAAFSDNAHKAAKSAATLEQEVDKLRAALAVVHAGTKSMTGMLDVMQDLDARIRADRDKEQTAEMVGQIGEALRTLTAEASVATEQATRAAKLFDALTQSIRTTEGETRRAAEALRVLADEAEARTQSLHNRGGWFWNRSR